MNHDPAQETHHHRGHGNFASYALGFFLSILLTVFAFSIVASSMLSRPVKISGIVWLGVMQLVAQLFFFLHLGSEARSRPRWNLSVFFFAVTLVSIVVVGSLWIMYNLDYNMMTPQETDAYLIEGEAIEEASTMLH